MYEPSASFPDDERFGLISQVRRAAVSVAANIVEGCGRGTVADFLRFLYQARGSLLEVGYYIHLARRLGYLSEADEQQLLEVQGEAARVLQGFIAHWEGEKEKGRSNL